ncbi:sirohydrochlorin chelatase [Bacillus sp. JCM 19041]|uniref:sirohydrochlorin chelatase n=1 Tax=Bacillus sp. JCM 19041 TaxID=1460637 RepID=UPI0006D0B224
MQAILYVGHGSRVDKGNKQFLSFIKAAKQEFSAIQTEAFIELASPTIQQGVDECVRKGAEKIAVVPVLLLTAYHANVDIPKELKEAKARYPNIKFTYGKPFGIEEDVIDIAVKRLYDAGLEKMDENRERGRDTTVLVVGRGSSDGNQPSDVAKIARLLYERVACDNVEIAFLAATTPTVEEGLKKCEKLGAKRVYVMPYLLFTGVLMEELKEMLAKREGETETSYFLSDFLGFDDGLNPVLIRRTKEAMQAEEFSL